MSEEKKLKLARIAKAKTLSLIAEHFGKSLSDFDDQKLQELDKELAAFEDKFNTVKS